MVISNERSVITIVLRNPLVVVVLCFAVILEAVVIKQGLDSGTLRAGSLRGACSPLG